MTEPTPIKDFLSARRVSVQAGPVAGSLRAPSSKSVTNRLLVMTALAEGRSEVLEPLLSDDTRAMAEGLSALGASVALGGDKAVVTGCGGRFSSAGRVVQAGLSGTTLRFLAAAALLADGRVVLDGEAGLRRRPLGPLLEALAATGAQVESKDGHAPVVIEPAGLQGGLLRVDAKESSQFASALLLVAPYGRRDTEIEVEHLQARGYVELTAELMRDLGAMVEAVGSDRYLVRAGSHYRAGSYQTAYDASAAAHLFALAVASGGEVTVANISPTRQPDAQVPELLVAMGATVTKAGEGSLAMAAPSGRLLPVTADLSALPDQLPTLACLAVLADGESVLSGISVSRGHESDRPQAVFDELSRLGADLHLEDDLLVVRGGRALTGGVLRTYGDHRLAMAFTSLAARVEGITIEDPGCVAKTYPSWWEEVAALGLGLEAS